MTLTINLPTDTIERLQAQAAASGKDVDTFVREALEVRLAVTGRSFREIMAPVHEDFRASGSDMELDTLSHEALSDARASRRSGQAS